MTDLRLESRQHDEELHARLQQFFTHLDADQEDHAVELLAAEAALDLRAYAAVGAPRPGTRAGNADQLARARSAASRTEHRISGPRFTVDGTSALGQCHLRVRLHDDGPPPRQLTLYLDLAVRFVREGGQWSIQRLDTEVVREEGDRELRRA